MKNKTNELLNNQPIIIKTRQERREEKIYTKFLFNIVKRYLEAKERVSEFETEDINSMLFTEYEQEWKKFVTKWNFNKKRQTVLRYGDFRGAVEYYEKNKQKTDQSSV